MITVTCPCGRFQQPTKCGRCDHNQNKPAAQLHCRDECGVAKRNARLAEALGISGSKNSANVVYSEDLVTFGKTNGKFVALVEKTLDECV
jgi:transcriptional repressor NF-X1